MCCQTWLVLYHLWWTFISSAVFSNHYVRPLEIKFEINPHCASRLLLCWVDSYLAACLRAWSRWPSGSSCPSPPGTSSRGSPGRSRQWRTRWSCPGWRPGLPAGRGHCWKREIRRPVRTSELRVRWLSGGELAQSGLTGWFVAACLCLLTIRVAIPRMNLYYTTLVV